MRGPRSARRARAVEGTPTSGPCSGRRRGERFTPAPPHLRRANLARTSRASRGQREALGPAPPARAAETSDRRAISSTGGSPARVPQPRRTRHLSPNSLHPRGPGPSLTQSSMPQLMVQGAGRGAPRGGARLSGPPPQRSRLPGRSPAIAESPCPVRLPPPPARRSSPRVSAALLLPGRSSAKWPEEAAAAVAAAPARPTPESEGRGRGGAGPRSGGGAGLTARARARPAPGPTSPRAPPARVARGSGRTCRKQGPLVGPGAAGLSAAVLFFFF